MVIFSGVAFILVDVLLAAALIALLCSRERRLPSWLESVSPLKGRWLWYLLLALTVAVHLGTGVMFFLLLTVFRG
jgi:hypothetical protein